MPPILPFKSSCGISRSGCIFVNTSVVSGQSPRCVSGERCRYIVKPCSNIQPALLVVTRLR